MQPAADFVSVNAIPVSNQISRYFAISKCLDHLLCNPSGRWVIGHIEVENFPAAMLQHQEHDTKKFIDTFVNKDFCEVVT